MLSAGLLAVVAVVVTLSAARQRVEPRREDAVAPSPGRFQTQVGPNLDAIRSAGF